MRPRAAGALALLAAALGGLAACAAPVSSQPVASQEVVRSEGGAFRVVEFATGLENPWGAAFLPDGRMLVTERPGRLRLVGRDGAVSAPLAGVPEVLAQGQGGLLDVALAPDFAATRQVYLCLAAGVEGGALTRLATATLSADAARLEGARTLLDAGPPQSSGRNHYGCRIAFAPDGKLLLSTGDRYADKERAQRLDDLAGKVLRLERDGRPAEGNPFHGRSGGRAGARPEIFTYGHRNPQGLAVNPATGSVLAVEFGARGGDEVNRLRAGGNYGWPVVSYGTDYDGSPIGTGRASAPGIEEPLRHWTPAISPSGANFYTGAAFPAWRGNLFLAALRPSGLVRLTLDGDRVVGEERLLVNRTRLRHVLTGPDGFLYLLTDEARGRVLRLEPQG